MSDLVAGAGVPLNEPVLDVDEIQGNIVPGFMKPHMILSSLAIDDPEQARPWLAQIASRITTLAGTMESRVRVRAVRTLRPRGRALGAIPDEIDDVWLNVAFSFAGLAKLAKGRQRLEAELAQFEDEAFKRGLAARSSLLGDPTNKAAEGHPANWFVGGPAREADVLLIIGADREARAEQLLVEVRGDAVARGLILLHDDRGAKFDAIGSEHFGFQDGISQPGVRGRCSDARDSYLTPRTIHPDQTPDAWLYGLPGQLLVGRGSSSSATPAPVRIHCCLVP